jgi:hypothetical protein
MKRALSYTGGIIGLAIGLLATNATAQTTAVGPYYATPSWDQTLPASTRFIVLSNFNSAAVLDRETGLVWERDPNTTRFFGNPPQNWSQARADCLLTKTGGRAGWRLPSVHELTSLYDTSTPFPALALPAGHPFLNVVSNPFYWSATAFAGAPGVWAVRFEGGDGGAIAALETSNGDVWCVRGGGLLTQY